MQVKRRTQFWGMFLVLGLLVAHANADLVGNWKFDEGAGNTAADKSGNGNDGSLIGGPTWVVGTIGSGALRFDGTDDMVEVPHSPVFDMGESITIAAWINLDDTSTYYFIAAKGPSGTAPDNYPGNFEFRTTPSAQLEFMHQTGEGTALSNYISDATVTAGQWVHVAVTLVEGATVELYVDGQPAGSIAQSGEFGILNEEPIRIASRKDGYSFFSGAIDDVQIYSHALTAEEIQAAMNGLVFELAAVNSPADGAVDVLRDVRLSWAPGVFADTHDVYLGKVIEEVDAADRDNPMDILVSQGLTDSVFDAGILDFGQTYYWRIDEVNAAPDNTVFKGEVWSFTLEPYAIPVEMITATASSFAEPQEPNNTVNGTGLTEADEHGIALETMWLSDTTDPAPSIQFELEQIEKLDRVHVWNHNSQTETILGFGIKEALIETSLDGENWSELKTVELPQATGVATYTGADVALDGVVARFVRLSPLSNHSLLGLAQYGLSEVRFYRVPNRPRELQPVNGAMLDDVDVVLSWRAGREAAAHEVYLGTDPDSLALAATVDENSFLAEALDYASTYYWQVVEVNQAETPAQYAGEVLSFTTPAYGLIDDFEMYADEEFLEIWAFWADGFEDPDNGAIVGNGNIGERVVVYEGLQSMPVQYDNSNAPLSEVTLQVGDENWLASGIKTLSLMVFGHPDNTGQLYVKINDNKVVFAGDTPYLQTAQWLPWSIDLSTAGGSLDNVTSLAIGVDGANVAGKLYIDAIHLSPEVREEFITPVFSYVAITGDEDCGIAADNTYTHALDFGTGTPGALINGVQFEAYNAGANGTLNFNREAVSGTLADHGGNAAHNVTGGLADLLTDMYYNGSNTPGGTTTWTLSGLTAGQTYDTRIYTRQWEATDSRNVTFVFDPDGDGPISDSTGKVSQDNARSVGFAFDNEAYYIDYRFTAVAGEDLVITLTQDNDNHSWHLYGLTNQEASQ